jgi:hypothetical protein
MSFATEISTVMNANTTLNSLVDGIYRDTTSTEFNATKTWAIYTYTRNPDMGVVGDRDFINMYTLYVEIYTDKASITESLSDAFRTYLTAFTSSTIRQINYLSETHSNAEDANNNVAFVNLMQFEILYQK